MKEVNGSDIAEKIKSRLSEEKPPRTFLAAFIFGGEDNNSFGFLRQKEKLADELAVDFRIFKLPVDLTVEEARGRIEEVAQDSGCGGALIQLPVPDNLNPTSLAKSIPTDKDIDVMNPRTLGDFYTGQSLVLPPAVAVFRDTLDHLGLSLGNKTVGVVGPGSLVGKPVVVWLLGKVSELIVLDKGSSLEKLKQVDLAVSGVGEPGLVKSEYLKKGAGVIDFGYGREEGGKIRGDLDVKTIQENSLSFYTPTPGGTGPILVAELMSNFYTLNGFK